MKFAYQGIPGSYSESCIKENYPDCEKTISCRTFQDAFELAKNNNNVKALVPEQNQLIGSINIETLILKYRLNIVAEHFQTKREKIKFRLIFRLLNRSKRR